MMRALPFAMLVGKVEFEPVLPWTGAAAEDLCDRKQVERALLGLRGETLEPFGNLLCHAQAGHSGEDRDERPDYSFGHPEPPAMPAHLSANSCHTIVMA